MHSAQAPDGLQVNGPDVSLISVPPAHSTATQVSFAYGSPEIGATFECKLDDAAFSPCPAGGISYSVSIGNHIFSVRALDALGNVGESTSYGFVVIAPESGHTPPNSSSPSISGGRSSQAAKPETMLLKKPARKSTKRLAVFRLAGGIKYRYKLDRQRWRTTARPIIKLRVKPGKHVLLAAAINANGEVDKTPVKYHFTTL